jgi:uncharacterized protein YqeY
MDLKERLMQEVKLAMKNADKSRLSVLRMITAEFKQVEIDERSTLDDARMIKIMQGMKNQRVESASLYQKAGREDLVAQENYELSIISSFLPEPLSQEDLVALVRQALSETEAKAVSDIAKVMQWLNPHIQGRASSKEVGVIIRKELEAI